MKKIDISIIIVHFQVESVVFECLTSIQRQSSTATYEVIIVDNGSKAGFAKRLQKQFPAVRYFKADKNLGYGGGNNVGAQHARGSLLFFLNPDTRLLAGCLDKLYSFLKNNVHVGIVAPTLLHPDGTVFDQQGSLLLTPLRAVAAHSIFHSIWPNNPVSNAFWLKGIDKNSDRQVEVVPGTAFVIARVDFMSLGGFDEQFFLYFEEYDVCRRILNLHKEVWMSGSARIIHHWEATTKDQSLKNVYIHSFKYYLTKYYGNILGTIVFWLTQISKVQLMLVALFTFVVLINLVVK